MDAEKKALKQANRCLDQIIEILQLTKDNLKSKSDTTKITAVMTIQVFHDFLQDKNGFNRKLIEKQERMMRIADAVNDEVVHI